MLLYSRIKSEPAAADENVVPARRTTRLRSAALKIKQLSSSPRVEISPLKKHTTTTQHLKQSLSPCDGIHRPALQPTALFSDVGDTAPPMAEKRVTRRQAHAVVTSGGGGTQRQHTSVKPDCSNNNNHSETTPLHKDTTRSCTRLPDLRRSSLRSHSHRKSTDDEHTALDSGNESAPPPAPTRTRSSSSSGGGCGGGGDVKPTLTSGVSTTGGSNKSSAVYDTSESCSLPSLVYQHG